MNNIIEKLLTEHVLIIVFAGIAMLTSLFLGQTEIAKDIALGFIGYLGGKHVAERKDDTNEQVFCKFRD